MKNKMVTFRVNKEQKKTIYSLLNKANRGEDITNPELIIGALNLYVLATEHLGIRLENKRKQLKEN